MTLGLAAAACAPVIQKAPVSGRPSDVAQLVGEWYGDYESIDSGRRGWIAFRLRAGADTAEGDVIMEPRNMVDPSEAVVPHDPFSSGRQTLSIRFVLVDDTQVAGVLNPYKDPDCGCTLTTTFEGTLRGTVIAGTFHSEGSNLGHIPQNGRWRVTRASR
jgi:hypothetical protein